MIIAKENESVFFDINEKNKKKDSQNLIELIDLQWFASAEDE